METTIMIIVIVVSIAITSIQIICLVKFFQLTNDINVIKKKLCSNKNINTEIFRYIVGGNKDIAKGKLLDYISQTPEFKLLCDKNISENYFNELVNKLSIQFKDEIEITDFDIKYLDRLKR